MKKIWSIGIVKNFRPSGEKPGFGFIASNSYGLSGEPRECVEVYFKENAWIGGVKQPKEGDVVSFKVMEFEENRQTAFKVEPLAANRDNLLTALRQTAYCPFISARLRVARRDVRKSPLALLFSCEDIACDDWDHIKSVILEYLRGLDASARDKVFAKFLQDASVAERLRQLLSVTAYDHKYGDVIKVIKQAFSVDQTPEVWAAQSAFIEFLSLNNFPRQLIARLAQENGRLVAKEIRCPDFSVVQRYKEFPADGDPAGRKVDGVVPVVGRWEDVVPDGVEGYYAFAWKFTNTNRGNLSEIGIRTDRPAIKLTPKDVVDRLYDAAWRMEAGAARQISSTHDTIEKQLTEAGDDVFVYELLQNANDYPFAKDNPVNVEIELGDRCLYFRHDGAEFTPKNVAAICSVNDHDKSDNPNAIGYKGIGFKTVFRYNSRVIVRTGGFRFSFDESLKEKKDGVPWRTTPKWEEDAEDAKDGNWRVQFALYPRNQIKLGNGEEGYGRILSDFFADERALLFIPKLGRVDLILNGERKPIDRNNGEWCLHEPFVEGIPEYLQEDIENQLRDIEHCRIPPKYRGMTQTQVSFACRKRDRRLIPEQEGCLYCFLPAKEARWGFKFLMNTDMIPNGPRSNIEYSISFNEELSEIAGRKFFDWISWLLTSGEYEYDSVFDIIPNFEDCLKNRNDDEQKFIRRFQKGFESELERMVLPTNDGPCVPASRCIFDATCVLRKFGSSFWRRLNDNRCIVAEQLWGCDAFARFVKKYGDRIKINTFDFADLRNSMASSAEFATWVQNPMANGSFLRFLVEAGELKTFKDAPIFLDNHKNVGAASEMYFYGQGMQLADRYLGAFSKCYRCLSKDSACLKEIEETIGNSFKPFGPRTFLVENILSQAAINNTREALKEIDVAKGFWSFIAHYRMWKGKERFADDYALLGGLPFTTETGEVCESIVNDEYSVYVADEHSDSKILGYEWFKPRVRFVNHKYFEGGEGAAIKDLLTSRLFANKKRLVGRVEALEVLVSVFDKFKEDILADIKTARSDMGVYDFLSSCVEQKCINIKWLEEQIVHWPVEGVAGELIERDGKSVWYYSERLVGLLSNGWIKGDEFVVLSQKYQKQMALFDVLCAKDFEKEGFGEFFRNVICRHLNKNCSDEELIDFHEYMQKRVATDQLVTKPQFDALKNTPVIVHTKDGVWRLDGCGEVLVCQKTIDVPLEISEGRLPETAKVLDSRLCGASEMMEYWQKLGCEVLDEAAVLKQTIAAYHECQQHAETNALVSDEFKARHIRFVKSMIGGQIDIDLLKGIKLLDANGRLTAPKDLVLSEVYDPKCRFQKYGCDLNYVSACYSEGYDQIEEVAECLLALGVRDEFREQDVGLLADKDFCKYYWTEYLPGDESRQTSLKGYRLEVKSSLQVLDNKGGLRFFADVYSPKLAEFARDIDGVLLAEEIFQIYKTDQAYCELIDGLDLRERLTVPDSIAWLGKSKVDDKRRGQVLSWIYELYNEGDRDLCSAYAESEDAVWINGEGRSEKLRNLYFLADDKIERAGALKTHSRVLKLDVYCGKSIRKKCVGALQKMTGRVAIDDTLLTKSIKWSEPGVDQSSQIRKNLEMKLLAYSVQRDGEEWHVDKEGLEALSFVRRDWIAFEYESLQEKNETYYYADGKFNYVNGWLDNLVFGDLVGDLIRVLNLACDEAFLKRVLNFKLNDVCKMMASAMKSLPEDCQGRLILQLKELGIADRVERLVTEKRDEPLAGCNALDDQLNEGVVKREGAASDDNVVPPAPIENEDRSDETAEQETEESMGVEKDASNENDEDRLRQVAEHVKIGDRGEGRERFDFTDDEITDYGNLWRNDGLSPEAMADQNRVTTFRLFRKLKEEGLEPELEERDFNRTFDVHASGGTDIKTKSGMIVHVASAFRGVAYISPFYWRGVVHGKCVVCAVYGHMREDFRFFRAECDFLACMNNDLAIIRIDGPERVAQVSRFFDCDRDLGFVQNVLTDSAFKVYSLIRVKSKTDMGEAFDRGKFAWSEASRQGVNDDDYGWD